MDHARFRELPENTWDHASHKQQKETRQQPLAENVFPNLVTGNGMGSQLRNAYEERRLKWLPPWSIKPIFKKETIGRMKAHAREYIEELNKLANNNLTRVTSDSLIRSKKGLETLTEEIFNRVEKNAQNATDGYTLEAKKQGFSMLAVDVDMLQYLTCRLKHPDQLRKSQGDLDVSEALVKKNSKKFYGIS